jgi:hypothetical protein
MCVLLKSGVKSPSNRILEAAKAILARYDEESKRQAVELVIHSGKRNPTFNLLCLICYGFKRDI